MNGHRRRASRALLLALVSCVPNAALAQVTVVAFPTDAEGDKGNAQIDRALRSALDARADAKLAPAPALDLEALQLAIECSGINTRCLREVAERTQGEVLIAPTLERKNQHVELRILYFSAKDAVTRYAAHKELARRPGAETLEAIPGMLDELFASREAVAEPKPEPDPAPAELPAPEVVSDPAGAASSGSDDGASASTDGRPLPAAPLLVAGGGAVLVGAGVVVGLLAKSTEDDYAKQSVTTPEQASVANGLRERGQNQALIANVLIGLGAATVAAGGIWLLVASGASDRGQTAVVPDVGPEHAALRISGRWGGL